MDTTNARALKRLNDKFYRDHHASFSQTRSNAWLGWRRVLESANQSPSVLDVACGNMRFKAFLDGQGDADAPYYGVDSCAELVPDVLQGSFQQLDIIDELIKGVLSERIEAPACDLTVCFGFMHHVPTFCLRAAMLRELVDMTADGGVIGVSFWQFAEDEDLKQKALKSTARLQETHGVSLETGDYLLGWQNDQEACRYCHSFTDDEILSIVGACGNEASLIDRFEADGRTGKMNDYVVLRKRSAE